MAEKKQVTEAQLDQMAVNTGKELNEQRKVKVKLYLPPEEKQRLQAATLKGIDAELPCEVVIVNGYRYSIARGQDVEVPETVAQILEEAGLI